MRKALVIGIDHYNPPNELKGCVNDAVELSALLEKNGNGDPNFEVVRKISSEEELTSASLDEAIDALFKGDADTALFYFAGHGIVDSDKNSGYLVTQDGSKPNWGINLTGLLERANNAYPHIKSTIIILDSCQSGFAGEVTGLGKSSVSHIGNGVTILTACHRNEGASEIIGGHGKFTNIMLDALSGAASDVLGRITPASLYAYVDQTLGAHEQRPIYKANVQEFITLREVAPKVSKDTLRKLPQYFPTASHVFNLDPSFEPDRGEEADNLKNIKVIDENVSVYRDLQKCNRHGLVVPTEHEHMWHSAVFNGGCKLTASGVHYRYLAENNKI